ncbi:alkaline phosphatase family protein [Candidatus Thiodictyon syntrophicum]|jgi:phospholipase C|uniref:Phosphoesterase n=1 Tax=Candidatus Thiodictyon syntrophicum TaxID=1166950 RepID=A0A2K8U4X3_9GAMM|nr:alkaline phosphatase family protein [Candidatus Thiodictyon syntrophicum]AUB80634.1 hypothetical protein THSYN_06485 [Candidatus Thiodictyon syntrophicum]
MAMNPVDEKPTSSFSEALRSEQRPQLGAACSEPVITGGTSYKLALFSQGKPLGWLGENDSEWAILTTDPKQALALEHCPYQGVNYYRIKGSQRYMSVSNRAYIGFYNWCGATGFTVQGTHLVADHNGQQLSFFSMENQYLYAWDAYTVLDATLAPIPLPVLPKQPLTAQIEHVVVLMLENRSFDNMLGGLYPEKTVAGCYRGLPVDASNPRDPGDPGKGRVTVFQGPADSATWIMPYPDPGELFDDMNEQIFGCKNPGPEAVPTMQGFAWNYSLQPGAPLHQGEPDVMPDPRNIMQYYSAAAVPMTSFLATQFAVCDGWFAAGPVQTLANRVFAHCGTPGLKPGTNCSRINNPDFTYGWSTSKNYEPPVVEKTVFELLDEAYPGEINWKVYYHDAPASAICRYVYDHWRWVSWDGGNVFRFHEHSGSQTNLEYDIIHNRLPKYSFIEPRYTDILKDGPVNSSHPGGAGIDCHDPNGSSLPPAIAVTDGERLLKEVYDILAKYPDTFKKTLLIVIYDEHGGLYDHVGPPEAVSPFAHEVDNFAYTRYGVRVPAILVNPCIPPNTIYPPPGKDRTNLFDHTSLISTVCAQFGLDGSLTPRSAAANTLKDLIPENPQVYPRPASPAIPGAATIYRVEDAMAVPMIDVAAAIEAADPQVTSKVSTTLFCLLLGLLGMAQQSRLKKDG